MNGSIVGQIVKSRTFGNAMYICCLKGQSLVFLAKLIVIGKIQVVPKQGSSREKLGPLASY